MFTFHQIQYGMIEALSSLKIANKVHRKVWLKLMKLINFGTNSINAQLEMPFL